MEILAWIAQWVVPLVGWSLVVSSLQQGSQACGDSRWGTSFKSDFLRSVPLVLFRGGPENHGRLLNESKLPLRIRHLWLGLRSLSFGLMFLLIFAVLPVIPAEVTLLFGLIMFIAAQWFAFLKSEFLKLMAIGFGGFGVFSWGFENLVRSAAQWTQVSEPQPWVFWLSSSGTEGAALGLMLGIALRTLTRTSGVAWWTGLSFLMAGIASLGVAWGFVLGDFMAGLVEDWFRYRSKDFKWRIRIGFALGLAFFVLSAPFQALVMNLAAQGYTIQLRTTQVTGMVGLFLLVESFTALLFFHFYFQRHQAD